MQTGLKPLIVALAFAFVAVSNTLRAEDSSEVAGEADETSTEAGAPEDTQVTEMAPIEVRGGQVEVYAVKQARTGTKTDTPIMETPMSVQVVPQQVLEDQRIHTISEAVRNVSGITPGSSPGQAFGDSFNIRGFSHGDATYEDGARFSSGAAGALPRVLANIERVEVLKGPASILFGQGEPGGLVNLVTKKPLDYDYYAIEQEFGSYGRDATQIDATGPLTEDGSLAYRLNVAYEDEESYRDFVRTRRFDVFPTLQLKVSPQTTAGLQIHYGEGYGYLGDTGIPSVNGERPSVPIGRNYNEPDLGRNYVDEYSVKLDWSHAFNDFWTLRQFVKYEDVSSLDNYKTAGFANTPDAAGNVDRILSGYDLDPSSDSDTGSKTWNTGLDLTGKFDAFGVKHTILLGADYYRVHEFYGWFSDVNFPSINVFDPVYFQPRPPIDYGDSGFTDHTAKAWGVYVQDQIELPSHVHLLLGVRHDRARDDSHTDDTTTKDKPPLTPRLGILWRPITELSLYANYTENFGQSAYGQFQFDGGIAPAETAQQFETGVKTELFDKRLAGSLSIYEITKQNVLATDPVHGSPYVIPLGEVRSRGFEADISGEIRSGWDVTIAYSYTDSRTTKADPPELIGRTAYIPHHSGSVFTTYELSGVLPGFRIGGGQRFVGSSIDYENNQLASYSVTSLFASYGRSIGDKNLTVQLNVENLFDKEYFPDNIPGEPLSGVLAARLEF